MASASADGARATGWRFAIVTPGATYPPTQVHKEREHRNNLRLPSASRRRCSSVNHGRQPMSRDLRISFRPGSASAVFGHRGIFGYPVAAVKTIGAPGLNARRLPSGLTSKIMSAPPVISPVNANSRPSDDIRRSRWPDLLPSMKRIARPWSVHASPLRDSAEPPAASPRAEYRTR